MYSARLAGVTADSTPLLAVTVKPCEVKNEAFARVICPLK
jgi:hypothetical protein